VSSGGPANKTERATPKRLDEARKKGQVAKSQDLNAAVVLLASLAILAGYGPRMVDQMKTSMSDSLALIAHPQVVDEQGARRGPVRPYHGRRGQGWSCRSRSRASWRACSPRGPGQVAALGARHQAADEQAQPSHTASSSCSAYGACFETGKSILKLASWRSWPQCRGAEAAGDRRPRGNARRRT